MGAAFVGKVFRCKREDLEKQYSAYIHELEYEYGHGGYSGTLKECKGLEITKMDFKSKEEAGKWLMDNAQKWEPALAVLVRENGEEYFVIGGWCSE